MRPAASAVGARGRSIPAQREECHRLEPAETSIPLQLGLRTGSRNSISARYLNMYGRSIKVADLCASLRPRRSRRVRFANRRKRNDRIYLFRRIHLCGRPVPCKLCNNMIISADWACAWVGGGGVCVHACLRVCVCERWGVQQPPSILKRK